MKKTYQAPIAEQTQIRLQRIVALSGGYSNDEACALLALNNKMIASFSRALLEGLNVNQTKEEFDAKLSSSINKIYEASTT